MQPRRYGFLCVGLAAAFAFAGCGSDVSNEAQGSVTGSGASTSATSDTSGPTSTSSSGMGGASASSSVVASSSKASSVATVGSGGADPNGIISISNLSALESETHVAAASNGFVCVTWIAEKQGGNSSNGYVFSTDNGVTFQPVTEILSPAPEVASDPVLAIDQQNNFYLTWIGFQFGGMGQPFDMHVYVSTAPAGTTTFGPPVEVTQPQPGDSFDKPWITVTNKNTIILTYAKTSSGGIYAARSVNQGQTWTTALIVEDGNFRNLVFPCAPVNGSRIWVAYHAGGGIGLRWSDDDGVTWPDANKTAVAANGEPPAFDDPSCVGDNMDVWVTYGLSNDQFGSSNAPKSYALRLAHSADGGATIDYRADAHDATAGMYYQHVALARETTGTLDITYYAGNSDGDAAGKFRRARSTDGGKTWEPSIDVHQPLTFLTDRNPPHWLGDYTGLWWLAGQLYISYADNTQANSHVAFATLKTP